MSNAIKMFLYLKWLAIPIVSMVIIMMMAVTLKRFKKFSTTICLRYCIEEIL